MILWDIGAFRITELVVLKELAQLIQGDVYFIPAVPLELLNNAECRLGYYADSDRVQALSIRYCGLTVLPEAISQLTELRQLDLTGNRLTTLPDSLGQLSHLETLYLDENQLSVLPESLGQLSQLDALHVDSNLLTALPNSLDNLVNLH